MKESFSRLVRFALIITLNVSRKYVYAKGTLGEHQLNSIRRPSSGKCYSVCTHTPFQKSSFYSFLFYYVTTIKRLFYFFHLHKIHGSSRKSASIVQLIFALFKNTKNYKIFKRITYYATAPQLIILIKIQYVKSIAC